MSFPRSRHGGRNLPFRHSERTRRIQDNQPYNFPHSWHQSDDIHKNETLYIWVTNNIERRIVEHKSKIVPGFSQKYGLDMLVYTESLPTITEAIQAEKKIKWWTRAKKLALIEQSNPEWDDLSNHWFE